MNKEMIKHEQLLQHAAFGAAEKVVEVALSKKPLIDTQTDETKSAMAIEVYKLNMFLVFGALQDKNHREDPRFQQLTDRLKDLYESEREEGLKKALAEVQNNPEVAKLFKDAGVLDDPFDAYLDSIKAGSKDFNKTPFGILARKLATSFFPEDLQRAAYDIIIQLLPQAAIEVINHIDKIPERYQIVE